MNPESCKTDDNATPVPKYLTSQELSDLVDMLCVENGVSYNMGDCDHPISHDDRTACIEQLRKFFLRIVQERSKDQISKENVEFSKTFNEGGSDKTWVNSTKTHDFVETMKKFFTGPYYND